MLMRNSLVLLGGILLTFSPLRAAKVQDSEHVNKLLSEAKTLAFQLKEDASTMETFTRSSVSPQGHLEAIAIVKEHVNALGRVADKLKDARSTASPWQKTAIDRIAPYLDELGGYTSAVIEHITGVRNHTPAEYNDYLEANVDYASDLAAMIENFVNYGKARQRVDRLGASLEVPPNK
jgi:hypothetical protein